MKRNWDGVIPERRYALFSRAPLNTGMYMLVLYGDDIQTAPKWGGFVRWVGSVRPAEKRTRRISQ